MGIMSRLRNELVDVVEWVDDSRHTIAWRFPRYRNQIKTGAQLIVRPGQTAIFVSQGKVADVFEPGQYTLTTKNLPILSTLGAWKHGFESPFKAEVYFAGTRSITDLKWGTPNPVMMRDADFGPIRVRAFGTYTLRARDPRILLAELVGTDSAFDTEEITELLRSIIAQAFADVVAKSEIPILDLAANYQELSEELRRVVIERVDDEYGLELPQLFIVNVSVPAEVEQALDTRSSMGMIGDLAQYQRYQLGQAIPLAATNPAGGLAGAGVGLGMGMAVAQQMATPANPGAAPQGPPPPPPAPSYYLAENGQSVGPIPASQLTAWVAQGRLRPDTLVWRNGMSGWTAAAQVPQLGPLFGASPPPLPQ